MSRTPDRRTLRGSAAVLAASFLALAVWVGQGESLPGEQRALEELTEAIGTSVDDPMVALGAATATLPLVGLAALAVVVLLRAGRGHDALVFALAVGVVVAANPVLKELVGRARPDVRPSPESLSSFSFPSGHAAGTASLLGGLVLTAGRRRRRTIAVTGALVLVIVAFSRLAIGAHYPSDIAGGWLWVGAWVTALRAATNR